jgi:hypothetical protein
MKSKDYYVGSMNVIEKCNEYCRKRLKETSPLADDKKSEMVKMLELQFFMDFLNDMVYDLYDELKDEK